MKLLVARRHNGIGDWLMCLAALRWLTKQHHDVTVAIDFTNAPKLVQEAYRASDFYHVPLRATGMPGWADVRIDHLVYDLATDEPFLDGICGVLSNATDREVTVDMNDLPFAERRRPMHWFSAADLALIGHGKAHTRGGKEWGMVNWLLLAEWLLSEGWQLKQLGGASDRPLPCALHYLGCDFNVVADVLLSCRAFIGMENGLMVLAGFLGVPQLTIYDAATSAPRLVFAEQVQLIGRMEPRQVAQRIRQWLS